MAILSGMTTPKAGFETVVSVSDYHDGPCAGVANFHGVPHYYECVFDEKSDEYSDSYLLTPLNLEVFKAAVENWEIFLRWRVAFDSGKTNRETHPALPQDRVRYDGNKRSLDQALASGKSSRIHVKGEFEVLGQSNPPSGVLTPWQVKWSEPLRVGS